LGANRAQALLHFVAAAHVLIIEAFEPAASFLVCIRLGDHSAGGLEHRLVNVNRAIQPQGDREDDGRAWTSPYMLARNLCLFTAAAAEAQPIDTVFVNFRDAEGLRQECLAAMRDGFTGKMAIHPNQVAVMNEVFTPSADEIATSQELIQLFADNPDAGALSHRGQMVDKAHVARAERILARARTAGRKG